MAVWQFNRGEWTEAYVFLRLLGDGRIYGANDNLEKDELTYIDIINIIKDEPNQYIRFERFINEEVAEIQAIDKEDVVFKIITAPELQAKATLLYNQIKSVTGDRKISVPAIEEYLKELHFTSPKANLSDKAKDLYGAKSDIIITSIDSLDKTRNIIGFSIKSHLGSSPTLFNCSSTSGFIYKIIGCTEDAMHKLNLLDSFKSIIDDIRDKYALEFVSCKNEVFADNLSIVDSQMDKVLSTAVLINSNYYKTIVNTIDKKGNTTSKEVVFTNLTDVSSKLSEINPLGIRKPDVFYVSKIKDLLFDSFAGLTASTAWNGKKKITGGYIDVNKDGEMLYYRAISDDIFCNYLLANTYFDRPDRGYMFKLAYAEAQAYTEGRSLTDSERNSIIYKNGVDGQKNAKKGDFGYVYCKDGEYYIDINFQIRFR